MPPSISLNADVGEGSRHDRALIPLLDRVSVACGGHAGDARTMRAAVTLATRHGVRVGAHPSYQDRAGFGRSRPDGVSLEGVRRSLGAQIAALTSILRRLRVPLDHVKLHGALYHDAARQARLAGLLVSTIRAARSTDPLAVPAWLGPPDSEQERAAGRRSMDFLREGFADRRYAPDGTLVPRGRPGAVLGVAAAVRQARRLWATGRFDTLCIHSDTPGCVAIARALRR